MAANKNDASTIGFQIGRLIQQYNLRITHARFRAKLMEEERLKASSLGQGQKTLDASISYNAWLTYAKNLTNKRDELAEEIKRGLIGYNANERAVWWAYFIERKSAEQAAQETEFSLRSVQRLIASMKAEMECRFSQTLPQFGEKETPRWDHMVLASFLNKGQPSEEYSRAVKDALEYGIVSIDLLELDPDFQRFVENGGAHR